MKSRPDDQSEKIARSQMFGWCLYDFAASTLMVNGAIYFPQWIVVDNHASILEFNLILFLAGVTSIITSPIAGRLCDALKAPRRLLMSTASLIFICAIGLVGITILPSSVGRMIASLVAFYIIICSYQIGTVFYNVLFTDLSYTVNPQALSGIGSTAGWLGGIFGVLATLPFVSRNNVNFSDMYQYIFLVAGTLYGCAAGISFIFLPPDHKIQEISFCEKTVSWHLYKGSKWKDKALLAFLLGYFLIMDATLTVQNNLSVYLDYAASIAATEKAALFLSLFFGAAMGGLVVRFSRKINAGAFFGASLFLWSGLFLAISATSGFSVYMILFSIAGALFGVTVSSARAFYIHFVPRLRPGQAFGWYNSIERASSLIGPLWWAGVISLNLRASVAANYRLALASMAVISSIAFLVTLSSVWRRI